VRVRARLSRQVGATRNPSSEDEEEELPFRPPASPATGSGFEVSLLKLKLEATELKNQQLMEENEKLQTDSLRAEVNTRMSETAALRQVRKTLRASTAPPPPHLPPATCSFSVPPVPPVPLLAETRPMLSAAPPPSSAPTFLTCSLALR